MRLPWARAPRAALSSPVTVLVAVVTGLVVSFVAASTVFHVSASGSAAVQYVNSRRCADDSGLLIERASRGTSTGSMPDYLGLSAAPLREAAAGRGLDLVRRSRYAFGVPVTVGGNPVNGRLVARDGALDSVRPTAGGGTDGAWVPSELAEHYGVKLGDELVFALDGGRSLRLPVTAVYPTIVDPIGDFWCSQRSELIKLLVIPEGQIKPPVILVSQQLMDRAIGAGLPLQIDRLQVTSTARPVDRDDAERLAAATTGFAADAARLGFGRPSEGVVRFTNNVTNRAAYPAQSAARAQQAVGGSLLPLTGVSLLVGLAAVVGLAGQWAQRRFGEVRLLWTRGVPPAALGGKAALELGAPLALGAALGWLTARLGVPALAPAPELDGWAPWAAAAAAAVAWLACLAVLAAAATQRVRREFQPMPGRSRLARVLRWVPWELVVAGLAVLSWRRLSGGALVVSRSDLLPRVDVLALMFPLLCLAVLGGVATRASGLALRLGHRARGWRLPSLLWAARRAAAQRKLTVALVAITGLAIGVLAVGVSISSTERDAVRDKGRIFIGSETSVQLLASTPKSTGVPAALRGSSTQIAVREVRVNGQVGRVLVVDPATAADGMTWRPEWAGGASLAELVSRLGPAAPDGTVPALQVGDLDPMTIRPDRLGSVRIVGRPSTFPAREHADGLLVISWDALAQADPRGFTRFVLSRDTPIDVVRAMEAAGEPTGWAATADGANDALPFLVVAWTFDFFVTLGLVLAAVAAAALLVSIEARRRATAVAHALLARMGLRVRSLYASYVAELAGLAVVSAAIGLSGGWLVLAVAGAKLDPAPYLSPTPVPVSLAPLAVLVVVVAAVLVALVAAVAVRAALRAPVRELLRG